MERSRKEKAKLIARIRLANFLQLPEEKFQRIVLGIERSKLFKKLACLSGYTMWGDRKVIFFKKFARTELISDTQSDNKNIIAKIGPSPIPLGAERVKARASFLICYFWPHSTREYIIFRKNFRRLKKEKKFNHTQTEKIERLFRKIRIIDTRKTLIHYILKTIIHYQSQYLETSKLTDLKPYSLLKLSQELGLDVSIISRALKNKYIKLPWDEVAGLDRFFPSEKDIRKMLIGELIKCEKNDFKSGIMDSPFSDDQISLFLRERYNLEATRRVIAMDRESLGMPFSGERLVNYRKDELNLNNKIKILVVDDEYIYRQLLTDVLTDWGHRAYAVSNGRQAIKIIKKQNSLRLCILDIRMPDMDGLTVFKRIKNINPSLKVILITGYGAEVESIVKEALKIGVYNYLEKPFDLKELSSLTNKALGFYDLS